MMRLAEEFDEFIGDVVNLNSSRISILEDRVQAIESFLNKCSYSPKILRYSKQGSWAHRTIIKPATGQQEFDADLVVYLEKFENWEPKDYLLELRRAFTGSATYKDKTSLKSRCVTLDYANDFHLDVVPIIERTNRYEVCNRKDNKFEETDGEGYTDWLTLRNESLGADKLINVIKLMKYLRDIKLTFSAKSILLTTVLTERVSDFDGALNANQFSDVSTSLKTVVSRLNDWLSDRPDIPEIENPALPGEAFTRHWDTEKYENFRTWMHRYREWIEDAYQEEKRYESIRKWRRIFGEKFAQGAAVEESKSAVQTVADELGYADLIEAVRKFGVFALNKIPAVFPHMEMPEFSSGTRSIPVRISAQQKHTEGGPALRSLNSGDPIAKNSGIQFRALQLNGTPFSKTGFKVIWQVVNTGEEAANAGDLRGEFKRSSKESARWESTKYHGVHWVQAFVVNRRTNLIDGRSERFFVVVD